MKNKLITFSIIFFLIIGFAFLFLKFIIFEKNISFYSIDSKNIFPDSKKLSSNIIIFKSNINISKYKIKTNCNYYLEYLGKKNDLYLFDFKLLDNKCENPNFILYNKKQIFEKTKFKLNIEKKSDIFSKYIDYPNKELNKLLIKLIKEKKKNFKYNKLPIKSLSKLKKNRFYNEVIYKINILNSIIENRNKKYISPVKGYKIAVGLNVIPNAIRPYRNTYTDGIHHGWDIIAPANTPVSALDDGIIIRVVDDFDFEDINNIIKEGEVSYTQKVRNLDILRGKQVWLKTSKGDVIFYSHLNIIYENIEEGLFIKAGENIGTIGKTGVPDKNYDNFHLHFPIQKNPYNIDKIGKYSYEDIMKWDWYLKGLSADKVIKQQKNIFIENAFKNEKK